MTEALYHFLLGGLGGALSAIALNAPHLWRFLRRRAPRLRDMQTGAGVLRDLSALVDNECNVYNLIGWARTALAKKDCDQADDELRKALEEFRRCDDLRDRIRKTLIGERT